MDRNRVTVRYATALIETSIDQNLLEQVEQDIRLIFQSISEFPGFQDFLENPGAVSSVKFKKVEAIFKNDIQQLTLRFLALVFSKGRENYLKDICRNFIDMSRVKRGIITASLTSAQTLNDKLIAKLKTKFEDKLKLTVEIYSAVKPEIIGGFIFSIDGQQYDASVATRIELLKKQLQIK